MNQMKTIGILLAATLFMAPAISFSQAITNSGFEDWTMKTLYEEPDIWTSTNAMAYMAGTVPGVTKTGDKVSGSWAVKLETAASPGDTIAGILFIGTPGNQTINGGYPFSGRPDSVLFSAKYSIASNDTAVFFLFFKRNDTIIGMSGRTFTGSQAVYFQNKIPITWFMPGNPDTLAALASSSSLDYTKYPGSVLYLDNILFSGAADTFPNGDFEYWTAVSSEEPDGWTTVNPFAADSASASKTTDSYGDSYALRLRNIQIFGGQPAGYITNGRFNFDDDEVPVKEGMKIDRNPEKLTGFYKYFPDGPDTATVWIHLFRWDAGGDSTVLAEKKLLKLSPASVYTYFELVIDYDSFPAADTLNIAFACSNYQDSTSYIGQGSVLFVDSLSLTYKLSSIEERSNARHFTVFPDPASEFIFINPGNIAGDWVFSLHDLYGRELLCVPVSHEGKQKVEVSGIAPGFYCCRLTGEGTQEGRWTKLIISR